jgi:hypothetical protein
MSKALQWVIIFTVVEIVTLVVWLELVILALDLPFRIFTTFGLLAILVLSVGLFVEHLVSVNVGAGRPPFGPLPPDRSGK